MIESVNKATTLLCILSNSPGRPLTLQQIAAQANMNKSTCSHILETLCDSLFVERISRKEGYQLGPWSYMLSRKERYQESLIVIAQPVLEWLNAKLNVTVFLDVLCNGRKFVIYSIDPAHLLEWQDPIFQGRLETTASGLLHLAYLNNEALRAALTRSMTATDPIDVIRKADSLKKTLTSIRMTGYAYLPVPHLSEQSYAFRVTDGYRTVASVGLVYSDELNTPSFRSKAIASGLSAAKEVGRRLTF